MRKGEDRVGRNPKTAESLLINTHGPVIFRPTRTFRREGKDKDKKDLTERCQVGA
ncbi:MAG: HU family DNA-binding protein [Leptospirillum sp.]